MKKYYFQHMSKKIKKEFIIPEKGSLGLLAHGHRGLRAWRIEKQKKHTIKKNVVKK